jgi:hypothetical protein
MREPQSQYHQDWHTQLQSPLGLGVIYPPSVPHRAVELTSRSSLSDGSATTTKSWSGTTSSFASSSVRGIISPPAEAKSNAEVHDLSKLSDGRSLSFDDSSMCGVCFGFLKSHVSAFVTLLKAMFGVSLLSSPHVIGETGLILGTLAYVIIISACTFACYLILKARAAVEAALNAQQQLVKPSLLHNATIAKNATRRSSTITYGVLGKELLGPKASVVLVFLVVTLHLCFGAGMLAASSHQLAVGLGWQQDDDYNQIPKPLDRLLRACLLFPIVSTVLQFRNRFELFLLCSAGLLVYLFGCVGSMVYAAVLLTYTSSEDQQNDDGSSQGNTAQGNSPNDMWEFKWSGIPHFVASTMCAIEGINLALPTANTMCQQQQQQQQQQHSATNEKSNSPDNVETIDAIPVVSAVIVSYGILTLLIAWIGYLGGLGGGEGTPHGEDACEQISYCLDSNGLTKIHQFSLGVALLLTLPIILYPSIEMLEIWADEREVQLQTGRTSSDRSIASGWNGFAVGGVALRQSAEPPLIEHDPDGHESTSTATGAPQLGRLWLPKHWKLRLVHAVSICILAVLKRSFESSFALLKGLGLSFVGFMLPCIFFVQAHKYHTISHGGEIVKNNNLLSGGGGGISLPLKVALICLVALGFFNIILVYVSVFTDHNFMPEHELHHPHEAENKDDDA